MSWRIRCLGGFGVLHLQLCRIFCYLNVGWCDELSSMWQVNWNRFLHAWDPHKCVVGGSSFIKLLARQWARDLKYAPFHVHCVNLTWPISMGTLAGKHTPSLCEWAAGFLASTTFLSSFIHSWTPHGTVEKNCSATGMNGQDNYSSCSDEQIWMNNYQISLFKSRLPLHTDRLLKERDGKAGRISPWKEEVPVLQLEKRCTPATHPLHGPLKNGSSIGQQLTEVPGVSALSVSGIVTGQ